MRCTRDFLLEKVGPELTQKIIEYLTGMKKGKKRELTTIVGKISITDRQAKYFELKSHVKYHSSPKMEKNAMLICANESYQRAENDLAELTGIKISHSTLHRLVQRHNYELPTSVLGVK